MHTSHKNTSNMYVQKTKISTNNNLFFSTRTVNYEFILRLGDYQSCVPHCFLFPFSTLPPKPQGARIFADRYLHFSSGFSPFIKSSSDFTSGKLQYYIRFPCAFLSKIPLFFFSFPSSFDAINPCFNVRYYYLVERFWSGFSSSHDFNKMRSLLPLEN